MSVLVDDLLLLARLDAGRPLSSAPVDMTRLAIDATSDAQVARPGHRWVLELPDDPELVLGDEHRLRQVLANLLSNAGRHTPDGTTVTVRVSGALPDGPALRNVIIAGCTVYRAHGGFVIGSNTDGGMHNIFVRDAKPSAAIRCRICFRPIANCNKFTHTKTAF